MKKASKILGIVGGTLSIAAAIIFFLIGSIFSINSIEVFQRYDQERTQVQERADSAEEKFDGRAVDLGTKVTDAVIYVSDTFFGKIEGAIDTLLSTIRRVFYTIGALWLGGGILGITGGLLAKKHSKLAGIMMLVGALAGFTRFLILILGGLFALSKEKKQEQLA